jgi:hypothetical protein
MPDDHCGSPEVRTRIITMTSPTKAPTPSTRGRSNHVRSSNNVNVVVHDDQPHPRDKTSSSTLDTTDSSVSDDQVVNVVEEELQICNAKKDRNLRRKDHARRAETTSMAKCKHNYNYNRTDDVIVALNDNDDGTVNLPSRTTRKPSNHGRSKSQRRHSMDKETTKTATATATASVSSTSQGERDEDDKMVARRHRSRGRRGRDAMPAATGENNRDQDESSSLSSSSSFKDQNPSATTRSKSQRRNVAALSGRDPIEPNDHGSTYYPKDVVSNVTTGRGFDETARKSSTVSRRNEIQERTRTRSKSSKRTSRHHHHRRQKSRPRRSRSHGRRPHRRTTVSSPQRRSVSKSQHARSAANVTDEGSELQSMEEDWNDSIRSISSCPIGNAGMKPPKSTGDRRRRTRSRRTVHLKSETKTPATEDVSRPTTEVEVIGKTNDAMPEPCLHADQDRSLQVASDMAEYGAVEAESIKPADDQMPGCSSRTSAPTHSESGVVKEDVGDTFGSISAAHQESFETFRSKGEEGIDELQGTDHAEDYRGNRKTLRSSHKTSHQRRNKLSKAAMQVPASPIKCQSQRSSRSIKNILMSSSSSLLSQSSHASFAATALPGTSSTDLAISSPKSTRRKSSLTLPSMEGINHEKDNSNDDHLDLGGNDKEAKDESELEMETHDDKKDEGRIAHQDSTRLETCIPGGDTVPPAPSLPSPPDDTDEVMVSPTSIISLDPIKKKRSSLQKIFQQAFVGGKLIGSNKAAAAAADPVSHLDEKEGGWRNTLAAASIISNHGDIPSRRGGASSSRPSLFQPQSPMSSPFQKLRKSLTGSAGSSTMAILKATSYLDLDDPMEEEDDDDEDHHQCDNMDGQKKERPEHAVSSLFSKIEDPTENGYDSWSDDDEDVDQDPENNTNMGSLSALVQFNHTISGDKV